MLWPSSRRSRKSCLILAFFILGISFTFGTVDEDEQEELPTPQTVNNDSRLLLERLEEPKLTMEDENDEKLDPIIESVKEEETEHKNPSDGIIDGFEKDTTGTSAIDLPESTTLNQIEAKKPIRAKIQEFPNTDLEDDQSHIMEILESLKVLHQEIENLKMMQQPAVKDTEKINRAVDEEEFSPDNPLFSGKDDDELLAEAQRAQAETSKRKWIPQSPTANENDSNFWGWVIGISIILVFLALGATFLAVRTYW